MSIPCKYFYDQNIKPCENNNKLGLPNWVALCLDNIRKTYRHTTGDFLNSVLLKMPIRLILSL